MSDTFPRVHPALDPVQMPAFPWPSPDVEQGITVGRGWTPDCPQTGVLRSMGYEVGKNGANVIKRWDILNEAFSGKIPYVDSPEHMKQWDSPRSAGRLKKLADTIASFARNAKRRQDPPKEAINDWECDLAWLKKMFYDRAISSSRPPAASSPTPTAGSEATFQMLLARLLARVGN